jgi:cytochrome c peroxidase
MPNRILMLLTVAVILGVVTAVGVEASLLMSATAPAPVSLSSNTSVMPAKPAPALDKPCCANACPDVQFTAFGTNESEESAEDEEARLVEELRRAAVEAESGEEGSNDGGLPSDELAMTIEELDQMTSFPGKLGQLPSSPQYPADNQPTPERIELGKKLYFDLRLSRDHSMSCASCHDPEKGWADGLARAIGFGKKELGRHSPTVINTAYNTAQFWDGRAATLEEQAVGPIMAAGEMSMQSEEAVLDILRTAPEYAGAFEVAYGEGPTMRNIGRAIAAFERTAVTGPSRYDKYLGGDKKALTESEKRGMILFITTASCTACHNGTNFTDNKFHALGVRQAGPLSEDLGRFEVTKNPQDMRGFKTPGLRNIEQSAPYMHDGSLATLEEVVEFYNKGGERGEGRSNLIKPLNMTASQKTDLVAFMRALTGPMEPVKTPEGKHFGK